MSTVPAATMREALYDILGSKRVREHRGWQTRTTDGEFDAHGVLHHWTASTAHWRTQRRLLARGYPGLPGPLCHFSPARDGKLDLIGWGNTNHAGEGDSRVLEKVTAGDYFGSPHGTRTDVNGNRHLYGLEYQYHPNQGPMPDEQFETGVLAAVAIAQAHEWDDPRTVAGSNLDHFEFTDRKWDREVRNLADRTRDAIQERMTNGREGETDMRLLCNLYAADDTPVAAGDALIPRLHTEWVDRRNMHVPDGAGLHPRQGRYYGVTLAVALEGSSKDAHVSLSECRQGDGLAREEDVLTPHLIGGTSDSGDGWGMVNVHQPVLLRKNRRYAVRVKNNGANSVTIASAQVLVHI